MGLNQLNLNLISDKNDPLSQGYTTYQIRKFCH